MIEAHSKIEVVGKVLEDYAKRGVFRGFSTGAARGGKATFKVVWHQNREYELIFDLEQGVIRLPQVLANVPADSAMYRELKHFIRSRHADDLPEHRRIDSHKAQVKSYNRKGSVSLVLEVKNGDREYGVRKFVQLVHEIFVTFLVDGNYFDYVVTTFELDPDHM